MHYDHKSHTFLCALSEFFTAYTCFLLNPSPPLLPFPLGLSAQFVQFPGSL